MCKPHFDTFMYSICEKNKRGYAYNMDYRPDCGFDSDEFVCGPDYAYTAYDYHNLMIIIILKNANKFYKT